MYYCWDNRYVIFFRFLSENWINWICTCCMSASLTFIWLHYYRRTKSHDTRVLFYDPLRIRMCQCHKCFNIQCTDVNCSSIQTREIIYCLRRATRTIDVCMFTLSNKPLAEEIIAAQERGIQIRVIVSNCVMLHSSKELECFRNVGIEMKHQKVAKNNYMHNKYAIVDSKYLMNGSMNWTQQATFDNWENVVITNSPKLVAMFIKAFENSWATVDL